MVEWISGWAQGIIVAVIIATIIEMLLPEGSSKKYIKVVVGIYILFTIVSPVITKITNKEFKLSDIIDLDEYIEAASSDNTYNELEKSNNENIKEVYTNILHLSTFLIYFMFKILITTIFFLLLTVINLLLL